MKAAQKRNIFCANTLYTKCFGFCNN